MNYQSEVNSFADILKKKDVYTKTQAVFAIIALFVGNFYYRSFFEGDFTGYGRFTPVIFALVFCAYVLIFFKMHTIPLKKETLFFAILTVIYTVRIPIWGADDTIGFVCILVIHLCALLMILSASQKVSSKIVETSFTALFISPFKSFGALFASFSAFFSKREKDNNSEASNEAGMVLIGIVVSLPILIIVTILLMSDSFFAEFTSDLSEFFSNFSIWDWINPVSIIAAMYIFGAIYSSATCKIPAEKNSVCVSVTVTNTIMIMISIIYIIFIAAQIEGYICMMSGNLPRGITYAEFARSGFFEICAVACINGIILYAANARGYGNAQKLSDIMSKIIILVTLLLIITAFVKLGMYVWAYGFTQKRFCAAWLMFLLIILFALSLAKLFFEKLKFSELSVYITAAMLTILFFVNFEALSDSLNTFYGF